MTKSARTSCPAPPHAGSDATSIAPCESNHNSATVCPRVGAEMDSSRSIRTEMTGLAVRGEGPREDHGVNLSHSALERRPTPAKAIEVNHARALWHHGGGIEVKDIKIVDTPVDLESSIQDGA